MEGRREESVLSEKKSVVKKCVPLSLLSRRAESQGNGRNQESGRKKDE